MNRTDTQSTSHRERPMEAFMKHASLVATYPRQSRNSTLLRPAWRVALWLHARQAAVAILLAYLAFGVAIPWLLLEAPSLPYAIAGTLSPL